MQDMCGRYQFTAEQCEEIRQIVQEIQRRYGDNAWQPGEIRPTASAPVLLGSGPELMRWGYQLPNTLVINARAETAEEKPLFRGSIAMRRCVIPSTGFYEWDQEKRKHLFRLPGEQVLYMAGLYEKREGENRYCILTTKANPSMTPIHDRMPLVLRREQVDPWLREPQEASLLLHTVPPELDVTSAEAQLSLW